MNFNKFFSRVLFFISFTSLLAGSAFAENIIPDDIEVITQDGKPVKFYSELIKGKKVGINFIYTTCKMICIPMSSVFSGTESLLSKEKDKDEYRLISVTLDPVSDSPKKLKDFKEKHKGGELWTLVTGDPNKIKALLKRLDGFEANIESHGAFTLIGNDKTKNWRRINGIKPPKTLVDGLKGI